MLLWICSQRAITITLPYDYMQDMEVKCCPKCIMMHLVLLYKCLCTVHMYNIVSGHLCDMHNRNAALIFTLQTLVLPNSRVAHCQKIK